jgi:O-antigen ligase
MSYRHRYLTLKVDRRSMWHLIVIVAIFCLLCPSINYFFATSIGGYAICALYLLAALSILAAKSNSNIIKNRSILWFAVFVIIYFMIALISSSSVLIYGIIFFAAIGLLSFFSIGDTTNERLINVIYHVSYLSLLIAAVVSLPILFERPGASRILGSIEFEIYGRSDLVRRGLAGFGTIYSMTMFVPVLFYRFHCNKGNKVRFLLAATIAVMSIVVFLSGYTTALLILVVSVFVYLLYKIKTPYKRVLLIILFILLVLGLREYLSLLLGILADNIGSQAVARHLKELSLLFGRSSTINAFDIDRFELMNKSIKAFAKSPLIGTYILGNAEAVGGHSTFFDILGGFGLIGFIPYFAMLSTYYHYIYNRLSTNSAQRMWIVSSILFGILQIVNPVISNYEIVFTYMCVVPCVLFYSEWGK